MDIEELKQKLAAAEAELASTKAKLVEKETEYEALIEENSELTEQVSKKDDVIKTKTNDLVKLRNLKIKKFSDLSDEEKDGYSPELLEILKNQEVIDEKIQQDQNQKIEAKNQYLENKLKNIKEKDPNFYNEIKNNLGVIKGFDDVLETGMVDDFLTKAYNMTGKAGPNPFIQTTPNGGGGFQPKEEQKVDTADTEKGKQFAAAMGLGFINDKK